MRKTHRNEILKLTNSKTKETLYFQQIGNVAKFLGISRQMVYMVSSPNFPLVRKAKDFIIEWVDYLEEYKQNNNLTIQDKQILGK